MSFPKNKATVWVCTCCMLTHANGECCELEHGVVDDTMPLELLDRCEIAMGMDYEEHSAQCLRHPSNVAPVPHDYVCDCDTNPFSWSACEGCGSNLGGERYAMTIWWN